LSIFFSVGHIKTASVNYDSSGQSTGTATVVFSSTKSAEKAVKDFDRAQVDGKTMSLRLIGQVITKPVVIKKNQNNQNISNQIQNQQQFNSQLNPFLNQNSYNPFNINPFAIGQSNIKSNGNSIYKPQQQRRSQRGTIKHQSKNLSTSSKLRKSQKSMNKSKKPIDAATLDKEMENYHNKATIDAVKAGQPKMTEK